MANFLPAYNFTLSHEGKGYFEDKSTGEKSKFGITEALLKAIKYPNITEAKNLLELDALNIYSEHFWDKFKLDQIDSQLIANKIFDMVVNMGPRGIKLTQAAINSKGGQCVIDGKMGPFTILTINEFVKAKPENEFEYLQELGLKCEGFYLEIANGPRTKYLAGWLKRARDLGVEINNEGKHV